MQRNVVSEQRQRAEHDHEKQPRRGIVRPALPRHRSYVDKAQHLVEHLHDVLPIDDAHREQRAEMEQHVEKQMPVLRRGHLEKVVQDGKMPR